MTSAAADRCSVKLEGEWDMDRAAELRNLLIGQLAALGGDGSGADTALVDLTAVTGLDACCCQVLAVFLENMRRRGIAPVSAGLPEQLRARIALLGFSDMFATTAAVRDESA